MDKILCVSHSSLNAGAERAFSEMVSVLSMSGHSVYCVFPDEGPLIEKCRPYIDGYSVITIPWWFGNTIGFLGKLKLLRKIFLNALQIKKYIRKTGVQKLIVNTIAIPGPAFAGRLASVPVYWFLHELGNDGFHLLFGEKLTKKIIGLVAEKVVCNSQYTLSHYKAFISPAKLSYAWQPVRIEIPAGKTVDSFVNYGVIGRLCIQKAQREAVEAMVFMKDTNAKLWLIGPDNNQYAAGLKSLIAENELDERVVITGETHKISEIYAMLDVLIVCSRNEALGRATIEAMKCGLPVIAPDAFGHSELIHDGINGHYYLLGEPSDLAVKMKILLNDEARIKMGKNGEKWANENFNDKRYANMLINILDS